MVGLIEGLLNYVVVPIFMVGYYIARPILWVLKTAVGHIGTFVALTVAALAVVWCVMHLPPEIRAFIGSAVHQYSSGQMWETGTSSVNQ